MKYFTGLLRVYILFFMALHICPCSADTICFLLTENKKYFNDSFVVQLSKPEDIAYARKVIAESTNSELKQTISASIALGSDGINRNYLTIGAPEWSWHIRKFYGFTGGADIIVFDDSVFTPTQIEWNPVWFTTSYPYSSIAFWNYRITSELGPILSISLSQTSTNLHINWVDLNNSYIRTNNNYWGTIYHYTLENRSTTSDTWKPVSGANWPLLTNQWSFPKTNISSGFFRVKAQLVPSPGWPAPYFGKP